MLAQPSGLLLGRPREWVKAANVHGAAPSSSRRYETHAAEVYRQSADGDDTHPNDVAAAGDHKSLMKRWRRQLGLVVSELPERPRLGRHDPREKAAQTPQKCNGSGVEKSFVWVRNRNQKVGRKMGPPGATNPIHIMYSRSRFLGPISGPQN